MGGEARPGLSAERLKSARMALFNMLLVLGGEQGVEKDSG